METHRDEFSWRQPPYEYDFRRLPIDLIFGDSAVRTGLEAGTDIEDLLRCCSKDMDRFLESRKPYLIYGE
jgi:uncharacterized protein YbbC (DUF1343 family)